MNRHSMMALVLPLLVGCEQLDDVKETLDGWTNPLVMQGIVLGVAEPDIEGFDLSETELKNGAASTVFLADAASADEMEEAPVTGAEVFLASDTNGSLAFNEEADGQYLVTAEDGLVYNAGELTSVKVNMGDSKATGSVNTPPAPDIDVDPTHTAGTSLTLDLSSQDYDSVLAVVFDVSTGEITFSNQPEGVKELYEFTHGSDGSGLVVDIPANAFSAESMYAVGVAGLRTAGSDDFEEMNTALSTLMAGKMAFYPVSTLSMGSGG